MAAPLQEAAGILLAPRPGWSNTPIHGMIPATSHEPRQLRVAHVLTPRLDTKSLEELRGMLSAEGEQLAPETGKGGGGHAWGSW